MFAQWDDQEFLIRLPYLRLAWSDLTPRETDRVASLVAEQHGVEKHAVTRVSNVCEEDAMHALAVFSRVEKSLVNDGLGAWLEVST